MAQLLIEKQSSKLVPINESTTSLRKGVLGRLSGPCAEMDKFTRNERGYSRNLWERVLESESFKEAMACKCCFGELNHPEDRLETDITQVAIVLESYSIDKEGTIVGTFAILDTPNGKILKSLCDFGSVLGVSSRGGGDLTIREGKEWVDENTYEFKAFDIVTLPAVKRARPTVVESVEYAGKVKTLTESVLSTIEELDNKLQALSIKSIVEKLEVPDKQKIAEAIDKKLESFTGDAIPESILEDLSKAIQRAEEAEKVNEGLSKDISAAASREKKLKESLTKSNSALRMISNKLKITKTKENNLAEQLGVVSVQNSKISTLTEQLQKSDLRIKMLEQSKKLNAAGRATLLANIDKLNKEKNTLSERLKTVNESISEEKRKADKAIKDSALEFEIARKKLNEKIAGLYEANKALNSSNKQIIESYVKIACKTRGLNEGLIKTQIKENMSILEVDKIIHDAEDYTKRLGDLPFERLTMKNVTARLVTETAKKPQEENPELMKLFEQSRKS